jgi:phage antirepressor YoqD-like protein
MIPKVEFYDAVTESDEWDEMSAVAKVLNMGLGRNKIFKVLRRLKVLRYNNEPYQEYCDRGYFRQIEQRVTLPYGETIVK